VWAGLLETYQLSLRAAGLRDHADEDADFAVPPDGNLRDDYAGLTPTTVPGAKTIRTPELQRLLEAQKPLIVDPLLYSWGRSFPGAIGLQNSGHGGSTSDEMQGRLRKKMQQLKGDLTRKIVAVYWNSDRFDGRNLACASSRSATRTFIGIAAGVSHGKWLGCRRRKLTCRTGRQAAEQ
jgi:hypothetical protein